MDHILDRQARAEGVGRLIPVKLDVFVDPRMSDIPSDMDALSQKISSGLFKWLAAAMRETFKS
jgi:hypothetical protein